MGSERPTLKKLVFGVYTKEEIHNLSVVEIKTSLCFNALDHPLKDGLYDLVMGPSGTMLEACETCKQTSRFCPGHFGHIDLPLPVVNPLFHREVFTLLKISCTYCFKLIISSTLRNLLVYQLKLLDQGHVTEAENLESFVTLDLTQAHSSEAMNYIVKDKFENHVEKLNLQEDEVQPSRTTESLRRKFLANFLRQITMPKTCQSCKKVIKRITSFHNKLTVSMTKVEIADKFKGSTSGVPAKQETTFLTPKESRDMLRKIWEESKDFMQEFFPILKDSQLEHPTDLFYMDVLLVTPPKARPVNILKGQIIENNQTKAYKNIVNDCIIIKNLIKAVQSESFDVLNDECKAFVQSIRGSTPMEKFQESWLQLQGDVDNLLDTDMNKLAPTKGALGLKQIMEKKAGILRMHMMGKRVNFAARTVITPDPNLQIQEIGIPEYFAKKLTYPTPVTFFNVEEMRKMVINGPDEYPGANLVENENGSFIRLFGGKENKSKRESVAKLLLKSVETGAELNAGRKKVHRHLLNGDVLLLNRQPTLHRPSIMAHKARILKGEKTFRMHYSNCKSYNADFDGDEMNAHFPQSDVARSEAQNLVNVSNHYLVPKDGTPLGGLIQDHIVSAVRLTIRGQMFEKDDYHQLVYQALAHKPGNIKLLPPCIMKPKRLWSGKQIISTIIINIVPSEKELISFNGFAKINFKSWVTEPPRPWNFGKPFKKESEMSESEVIIRKGILVSGVLDKQHFGATPYGLTHCLFELYGGECSSKFLDSAGKLGTAFLQLNGFTLGVEDILVMKRADEARNKIMKKLRKSGDEAATKALNLEEVPDDLSERLKKEFFKDRVNFKSKIDQEYKKILDTYTNEINKVCLPQGLISKFPFNNLQLMVTSGAKGSTVNTMQISCLLGQIELEGQRPPWMISGKSLPSFKAFETQPTAGGYVDSRFMTGLNPQEFFFHCMAGREGLIDTAVKTSRSGYLQRCLIKHLEGISVCYDGTVRDHDGSVMQFAYGEDGMEVQKSTFFKPECMDFLYNNRDSIVDKAVIKQFKESTEAGKEIEKYRKKLGVWGGPEGKISLPFTIFSNSIRGNIADKYFKKFNKSTGRSKAYSKILKRWKSLSVEEKEFYSCEPRPDPVISKYNRNCDFGVITEKLEELIKNYLDGKEKKESKKIRNMLEAKYMLSLCQPGEPVGLLAAQSVGEPSTQMTLNTFHFAGRGEMNVTLGIPRLREILMTASKNIKTPYIEVPLKKKKSEKKMAKNAKKIKKIFQRVTLADVLEKVVVDEKLQLHPAQLFTYTVKFHFLPHACYKDEFDVKPQDILLYMEKPFLISICKEIRKLGKKYGDIIYETKEEKAMNKPEEEEEDADDVDAAGSASKKIKTMGEEHESSDEEEELDDDDATKAKLRGRHQENQEYEEPEESEEEKSDEEMTEGEKNGEVESGDEEMEVEMTKEEMKDIENRKELLLKTFSMIKNYKFDLAKNEWCEFVIGVPLTLSKIDFSMLLRTVCEKSVLYEVPNVKRAFVNKKPTGELILKTEGVNFIEIFKFNKMLDLKKLYSNDIHRVIETYGIEAGVRIIVKELRDVFAVYGITVDPRHLILIADYMTHQGYFSPFNRTGIADSSSPLHQMTFESSTNFLKHSLVRCRQDYLQSPSSCIMVGKYCQSGTGCFGVSYVPQIK